MAMTEYLFFDSGDGLRGIRKFVTSWINDVMEEIINHFPGIM